jgi:hypothetical protein
MAARPRSAAPGASLPISRATVLRKATAGGEAQVVMVAARRDQRTTSVVRGSLAAV